MATPLIEPSTSRLVLRQWRESDRQAFAALNADPLVMKHCPAFLSHDESDALMDHWIEQLECHGYGQWAVEVQTSGDFTGFVGLAMPTREATFTPCAEIG